MIFDPGGRYQRKAAEQRQKMIFLLLLLMAVGTIAYWWGGESVRSTEVACHQQASGLEQQRLEMEKKITDLSAEVQTSQLRYQRLEAQYAQDIPEGDHKVLSDLVKVQLKRGFKPSRLASIIEAARPPKNCTEPQVKRFVAKTPVYSGPHGSVSFGNGAVTVSGEGAASVGPAGQAEAWYDSGKPVKIIFTETGGKETVKEGLLPIQYATIVGNKEYRFTVAAGERSFITITSDSCDYP